MSYSATDDAEQVEPDKTHDWRYQIGHARPASCIVMMKQQVFRGHDLCIPDVGDDPGNLSTRDKAPLDAGQELAGQCAAQAAIAPFLTLFDIGQGMRFASA